jgi:hypothetical protein
MKAKLESFDDSPCKGVAGYLGAVRVGDFLAVTAKTEWGAIRASRLINTKWSAWAGLPDQAKLMEWVRSVKVNKNEEFQKAGNVAEAFAQPGMKVVSASYDWPVQTHGSLGPSCAIAEFKDGKLTSWSASQQTHLLRKQMANMLQMKPEDVRCIYLEGAGCYGRNGHEDAAADAALIAKATGKPVRVQWMRHDEHGWDPKGPPTLLDHKAALDDKGNIVAWESAVFIPDRPKDIVVTLVAADLANLPFLKRLVEHFRNSLAFSLWQNQQLYKYYVTGNTDILREQYRNLVPPPAVYEAVYRLEKARTPEEKWKISFFDWYNASNALYREQEAVIPRDDWDEFLKTYGITEHIESNKVN